MPTLLPALSGLLLSLVGCGGRQSLDAAPLTAWPEGPVILLRVDAGLIVVNPEEGGPRRLTSTPQCMFNNSRCAGRSGRRVFNIRSSPGRSQRVRFNNARL